MEFHSSFGIRLYFVVVVVFGVIGCHAQDIGVDFYFKDNGLLYEVIFEGQENVALVCRTTDIEKANITISSPLGMNAVKSDGEGNCLEYALSSVKAGDHGSYTCSVSYIDAVSGEEISVTESLELNVHNDEQACFRNGTAQSAYDIGDVLLLSCYCNNITNCLWIRSVPGRGLGEALPMQDISEVGRTSVVRAIVGPLDEGDLLCRYDCVNVETTDNPCSLGPASISESDPVRDISTSSVVVPECPKTATTSSPVMTSPNTGEEDNPDDSGDGDDSDDKWIGEWRVTCGLGCPPEDTMP